MALDEIKALVAELKDYISGATINGNVIINLNSDSASSVVNCADVEKKKAPKPQNTNEEVAHALREITGEHKPIDSKQKWAGAYWYLRWAYNFPVDVQEFCNKIQALPLAEQLEINCNYDNIRRLTSLSFIEQDPRQMDKVKPSKMDMQAFYQCREVALKLEEKLKKSA